MKLLYGISMAVTAQGMTRTASRFGSQITVEAGQPPSPPFIVGAAGGIVKSLFERSAVTVVNQGVATAVQSQPTATGQQPTTTTTTTTTQTPTVQSIDTALQQSGFEQNNSHGDRNEILYGRRNNPNAAERSDPLSPNAGGAIALVTSVLKSQTIANRGISQNTANQSRGVGNGGSPGNSSFGRSHNH